MFSGIRDSMVKNLIASKISRYGKLTDLRLNSKDRTILLELWLEGEQSSLVVEILGYRLTGDANAPLLTIEKARASRPWLDLLMQDFLIGRPLPIPPMALLVLGDIDYPEPSA
jgi:hypothetical protein